VSTPELTDGTGTVISGSATGPAAGVSFQSYAAGPMCVYVPSGTTTISGSATSIEVVTGTQGSALDYKPLVGQTLHIQVLPTTLVELQVTAVSGPSTTGTGTVYTVTLSGPLGNNIVVVDPVYNKTLNVACFLSTPTVYVVENGQLVRITLNSSGAKVSTVLANFVASATPFTVPTINSASNSTFITVTNFTAIDPSSSNRGYQDGTTPMTVTIPHFAQLTAKY